VIVKKQLLPVLFLGPKPAIDHIIRTMENVRQTASARNLHDNESAEQSTETLTKTRNPTRSRILSNSTLFGKKTEENSNNTSTTVTNDGSDHPSQNYDVNNTATDFIHTNLTDGKDYQKPIIQFQIGLSVGSGLGKCYLELQKLDHSVSKLSSLADDIKGVLLDIIDAGENKSGESAAITNENPKLHKSRSKTPTSTGRSNIKSAKSPAPTAPTRTPITSKEAAEKDTTASVTSDVAKVEECLYVTQQMNQWQKDVAKRIQTLNESISNLHAALEVLDEAHSTVSAGRDVEQLKRELEETKKIVKEKDNAMTRMKRTQEEKIKKLEEKEKELEEKEKGLDDEVNDIAKQSKDLKDRSELLIRERDDVRKQREHWQQMVDEQKQRADEFRKQQEDVDTRHKGSVGITSQYNRRKT